MRTQKIPTLHCRPEARVKARVPCLYNFATSKKWHTYAIGFQHQINSFQIRRSALNVEIVPLQSFREFFELTRFQPLKYGVDILITSRLFDVEEHSHCNALRMSGVLAEL